MTTGLIIRSGNDIIFDVTTRTGQFFGSFQTNGNASGTLRDLALRDYNVNNPGTFFAYTGRQSSSFGGAVVTANLNTGWISWELELEVSGDWERPDNPDLTVFYGVY